MHGADATEQHALEALRYRDTGFFWRSLMRACCLGHLIKFPELMDPIVHGLGKASLELG